MAIFHPRAYETGKSFLCCFTMQKENLFPLLQKLHNLTVLCTDQGTAFIHKSSLPWQWWWPICYPFIYFLCQVKTLELMCSVAFREFSNVLQSIKSCTFRESSWQVTQQCSQLYWQGNYKDLFRIFFIFGH